MVRAGFLLLLLVHEMGHVIQLRREGMTAGAPIFIPFMGAYIGMKEMPKDAAVEARVGPRRAVLGSLGCLVPLASTPPRATTSSARWPSSASS